MLRRVVALLLIASSGWLLYQTANDYLGGIGYLLSDRAVRQLGQAGFVAPAIGGALGLMGGLIVFFGGPGGAAIAMLAALLRRALPSPSGNRWTSRGSGKTSSPSASRSSCLPVLRP